jgi:hypothetical protein
LSSNAQDNTPLKLVTSQFSIQFPNATPANIESDRLENNLESYLLHYNDSTQFHASIRERVPDDNTKETFQFEIDLLGYWTLAHVIEQKKGRINGQPTLSFKATDSLGSFYFLLILTKSHYIKIAVYMQDESHKHLADAFIDSFAFVK